MNLKFNLATFFSKPLRKIIEIVGNFGGKVLKEK